MSKTHIRAIAEHFGVRAAVFLQVSRKASRGKDGTISRSIFGCTVINQGDPISVPEESVW